MDAGDLRHNPEERNLKPRAAARSLLLLSEQEQQADISTNSWPGPSVPSGEGHSKSETWTVDPDSQSQPAPQPLAVAAPAGGVPSATGRGPTLTGRDAQTWPRPRHRPALTGSERPHPRPRPRRGPALTEANAQTLSPTPGADLLTEVKRPDPRPPPQARTCSPRLSAQTCPQKQDLLSRLRLSFRGMEGKGGGLAAMVPGGQITTSSEKPRTIPGVFRLVSPSRLAVSMWHSPSGSLEDSSKMSARGWSHCRRHEVCGSPSKNRFRVLLLTPGRQAVNMVGGS